MSDSIVSLRQRSLAKDIRRHVALAHINDQVVDTDNLAKMIQAKHPHASLEQITDQIIKEVISRRGALMLSKQKEMT